MPFILSGTTLKGPGTFEEGNSTQVAQQRTLSGAINRDYMGSNKRVWTLNYENINITSYAAIKAIYDSYLLTGTTCTWQITEANYTIASTRVHVDIQNRGFDVRGSSYLSNFSLILTEA